MYRQDRAAVLFAAGNGFAAVALGAFAAHAVSDPQAVAWLRTGSAYQLAHAVAALACAGRSRTAALLLNLGGAVFAATLYAMALGGPRVLGAVTPIGGVLMLAGWAALAWTAVRVKASPHEKLDG
ncbi:DUF423 domain-containing protein [Caulobacter sp. 17J80-11]|uniref:DUF423 domain-containing protein n=1 Tax=Caulobacter sp. 17J80-11 TaxID=2763502 RepID=UPI0016535AB5|nr:DUF423 domain-containing protein [Caulobacter sp. 17J80-11]MBC6981082.1 DUF423 domain-containing protein [Caulobacter sp. 17J80-11]